MPMPEARSKTSRTRAGSPKTPWPAGFTVSPAIDAMCRAEGLPNPYDVIRDFESSARANSYRYADWEAAFRKWMRSAITRRDYPAWAPSDADAPQKTIAYGPPAPPPPGLPEQIEVWHKARTSNPIADAAKAADAVGAPVFLDFSKRAGGDR